MSHVLWILHLFYFAQFCIASDHVVQTVVQRNVQFLKGEIEALKEKLDSKFFLWNKYRLYQDCVSQQETPTDTDSRRCLDSKKIVKILKRLEEISKSENDIISRILKKTEEIFPQDILVVNGLDDIVENNGEEMKAAMVNILSPLSIFSGTALQFGEDAIECNYITEPADKEKMIWTRTNAYSCSTNTAMYNTRGFMLLPNGNIVNVLEKSVHVFLPNGTLFKSFSTDLPEYVQGTTYWKESKILVLAVPDDTGMLFEIDLETETASEYTWFYPMDGSSGLSTVGNSIFACSDNGWLFIKGTAPRVNSRARTKQYGLYYYRMTLYSSEHGSDYAAFSGKFFNNKLVLITSKGEQQCSFPYQYYSDPVTVASDGMFIKVQYDYFKHTGGFQAYDKECNPLGDFVTFEPTKYYPTDFKIQNNNLVFRMQYDGDDYKVYFTTYKFQP